MDPKTEVTKIWKDLQASAKEFAHYSLTLGSKYLDVAATRIKGLEEKVKARAEKLADKAADAKHDAAAAARQ